MLHSQSLNKTPLQPWLISQKDGTVLAAHCNCKAGLGEVCSHVGATLFYLEAAVKLRNSKTVTQSKAYWLLPSGMQKIDYKPIRDIDFSSSKTKKRQLDTLISEQVSNENGEFQHVKRSRKNSVAERPSTSSVAPLSALNPVTPGSTRCRKPSTADVPMPSSDELNTFFTALQSTGTKPVILSLIPEFSSEYIPTLLSAKFPVVLTELRDQNCFDMEKDELTEHCKGVFQSLKVSTDEAVNVEKATKQQAASKEWYRFRTGRVTASRLKSACRTSIENPSQSLLKAICYPSAVKFRTVATKWGCDHEKTAQEHYQNEMSLCHDGVVVSDTGLIINPEYPYLGASPDAVVHCDCCGDGCVEIKCPYCSKDKMLSENVENVSCLEIIDNKLRLKKSHAYYYQVQCQIFVCEKEYCDFVMWTNKDYHCERIEPDTEFWNTICAQAKIFFEKVVLLELVGKFFSKPAKLAMSSTCILKETQNKSLTGASNTNSKQAKVQDVTSTLSSVKETQNVTKPSESDAELDDSFQGKMCICQADYDPDFDSVIGCDNQNCPYVWLHYSCIKLDLETVPDGNWYCPACSSLPEFQC